MNSQDYKKLKHYNTPGHAHELTFSCNRRNDYLKDNMACELFINELDNARNEHQFRIWAYVLMPNHVHLLIWPLNETYAIDRILNDCKGRFAIKYRDYIKENHPDDFNNYTVKDNSKNRKVFRFWQPGGGFDRNPFDLAQGGPVERKGDPRFYRLYRGKSGKEKTFGDSR